MKKILLTIMAFILLATPFITVCYAEEASAPAGTWAPSTPSFDPGRNMQRNSRLGDADPVVLVASIINWLLTIIGLIALALIIYGGFIWMMSRGNEEETTKAKNIIQGAIIGLIVILASYGIASYVFSTALEMTGV